ncbi:lipopolysaccharide biosynthesis protein, putative [Acaryochloris marina MBIC11017]|uniref:non-specific protein-tyrosine kinase n=1 Tax=Acaryochloris marina (strain MBIC 11017) TaxID=329726 RepID=B0C3H4_ACAM1|nr:lipopolysaccharide biosynthesis protein, putative [Acaryochloris marina MBIC11017]
MASVLASQISKSRKFRLILQRHWLPSSVAFTLVLTLGTLAIKLLYQPLYVAEGQLRFTKVNPISKLTTLGTEIGNLDPLDLEGRPLETESAVIQSTPLLQTTLNKLSTQEDIDYSLDLKGFRQNFVISDVKGTDILRITYKSINSEHAAAAVNLLMQVYLENHLQDNRNSIETASKFISERIPQSEKTVQNAERALRQFKQKNQIVDLSNREQDAEAKIAELQGKISDAQAQIAQLQTEANVLSNQLGMTPQQAMAAVSLSQSAEIRDVLTQLQQTESQLALQTNQLTATHPTVLGLARDVNKLKALFQQRAEKILGTKVAAPESLIGSLQEELTADLVKLEAQRQGLVSQVIAQSNTLESYKQQLNIFPGLAEKQRELERKLEAAQSTYALLLQKQQEILAEANQTVGNARVLVPAQIPKSPVTPNQADYLATGLLGVLAFFATAYILETLDKSIRTVEDAVHQFEYPLLGVIPAFGNSNNSLFYDGGLQQLAPKLFLRDFPDSPVSNAFRMLQVSLKSVQTGRHCQTLVVTSTSPQEGKSTVVANLAMALAQAGNQVLVVDGNLRNPFQDRMWDVLNEFGLSNVLFGQADLDSATQSVTAHVDVMTAGNLHANAMGTLESKHMTVMLNAAKSIYNYILIDAPSLNSAADVSILGGQADGIVIVVKPGIANLPNIAAAKELLMRSGQRVTGLIINGALSQDQPYGDFQVHPMNGQVPPQPLPTPSPSISFNQNPFPNYTPEAPSQVLVQSNGPTPEELPLRDLQDQVEHLRAVWIRSVQFVDEQEEELVQLHHTVSDLQEQIRDAGGYSHSSSAATDLIRLELRLAHEKERLRLFEKTLAGQRQRLQSQQAVFQHHLGLLQRRIKRIVGHLD